MSYTRSYWKSKVGEKFGRLTIGEIVGAKIRSGRRMTTVKCLCDCGIEVVAVGSDVTNGNKRSCGCLYGVCKSKPGSAFRVLLNRYKQGARLRSIDWSLTKSEFETLVKSPCYFTGRPPAQICRAKSGEVYVYNGIDRLDSNKGYTMDNCVSCCKTAQYAKHVLSKDEFITLCKEVVIIHT